MTNKPEPFDPTVYLHSPDVLAKIHKERYDHILTHPGIPFFVPSMDRYCLPQRPGDLTLVIGLSGHGKSSFLARQAKRTAQDIADRGKQKEECVIYVSWEQHASELEAYFEADDKYTVSDYAWGRVSPEMVMMKVLHRAQLPLWMIGYSQKNIARQTRPLTLPVVFQAIESMSKNYDSGPRPVLLCFDYAQLIPDDTQHGSNRYEQVSAAIRATKALGLRIGCPTMVASQAKQEVLNRDIPIPGQYDGYESSGTAHVPDKIFGIWRPYKTHRGQETVRIGGQNGIDVPVTPETFVNRLSKQRLEDGEKTFIMKFSMAELKLADMELGQEEPYL